MGTYTIFFSLILTQAVMFFTIYKFSEYKNKYVLKGIFNKKINYHFLYTIIPVIIGTMMLNAALNYIMPVDTDSTYTKFMIKIAENKSLITLLIIPIAIIAPISEELMFRGIILRGVASNHNAKIAITISALFFAIVHLNLAQIPNAFILGIIFAIITIHTKNILYTIIYHAINNFLATSVLYFINVDSLKDISNIKAENSFDSPIFYILMAILGFIFIYLGLVWTIRTITKEKREIIPNKKELNDYLASFEI